MSNFLERIATTSARPQSRLQPMLGSIFAPAPIAGAADFFATDSVEAESLASARTSAGASPVAGSLSVEEDGESTLRPAQQLPLKSKSLAERPAGAKRERAEPTPQGQSVGQSELANSDGGAQPKGAIATEDAKLFPAPFQPLLPVPEQAPSRPLPRESAISPARLNRPETVRHGATAAKEPDEIHIHIGRIEVAAIAQVARPVTNPAPRKSLNLDDYLRGKSGRAR